MRPLRTQSIVLCLLGVLSRDPLCNQRDKDTKYKPRCQYFFLQDKIGTSALQGYHFMYVVMSLLFLLLTGRMPVKVLS